MKHYLSILPVAFRTLSSRAILGQGARKIFAIGFNKTGTTSIHRLFKSLGYRSCHSREWQDTRRVSVFLKYDAFSDAVPDDFRRLDHSYPQSKFILNVRDLDTWIDSRIRYIDRTYQHGAKIWDPFSNWSTYNSSIMEWILQRNRHHAQILQYFASTPKKLITVNYIRDPLAATKICRFLGHPAPSSKPHHNASPICDNRLQHEARISTHLAALGVAESDWTNDIFCPSIDNLEAQPFPLDTNELDDDGHCLVLPLLKNVA